MKGFLLVLHCRNVAVSEVMSMPAERSPELARAARGRCIDF
jgi:hypothetical protein